MWGTWRKFIAQLRAHFALKRLLKEAASTAKEGGAMSDKVQATSGGISFCGLLTVLFIGLKITNYIDWSWWWVFAPIWIPWAIILGILAIAGVIWAIVVAVTK